MLKKLTSSLVVALAFLLPTGSVRGFSLLGQFDTWQTPDIGYGIGIIISAREQDLGGPMNLGEEYRWNSPVLVYGFDTSFLEFFGEEGVRAVTNAIKVFNDLPRVSSLSPTLDAERNLFPRETLRYNYTAQQLGIVDVKSLVMSIVLEQLGLAAPERYTYTLRARVVDADGIANYTIAQRNFDPVPVNPASPAHQWRYTYTPYVNGTLYTYLVRHYRPPPVEFWDAQEIGVDVALPRVSVVAAANLQAGISDPRVYAQVYGSALSPGGGLFFTGLTRDDIGGLRYLLHPGRTNVEVSVPGSVRGTGAGGITVVDTGGADSPWRPSIPFGIIGTNGTPTPTNLVAALVDPAKRGGVDKVNFVRLDVDSLLGRFLNPLIIRHPEAVFDETTGRMVTQTVERQLAFPDILFTAADIGTAPNSGTPYTYSRNLGFVNNSAQNSNSGNPAAGPGTMLPGEVSFNKVGPWSFTVNEVGQEQSFNGFIFGSFDGSTNAPIVYPTGVSLYELERRIRGLN
jgi:hypothetical protein